MHFNDHSNNVITACTMWAFYTIWSSFSFYLPVVIGLRAEDENSFRVDGDEAQHTFELCTLSNQVNKDNEKLDWQIENACTVHALKS